MKILLYLLLLIASPALAQMQPPGRANQIVIQAADSGMVAWARTAQVLAAHGYGIAASDKDLLTLSTTAKHIPRAGDITLSASVNGRIITLSGAFVSLALNAASERIAYRGMKGSPFMRGWDEMRAVSADLGGRATYRLQP